MVHPGELERPEQSRPPLGMKAGHAVRGRPVESRQRGCVERDEVVRAEQGSRPEVEAEAADRAHREDAVTAGVEQGAHVRDVVDVVRKRVAGPVPEQGDDPVRRLDAGRAAAEHQTEPTAALRHQSISVFVSWRTASRHMPSAKTTRNPSRRMSVASKPKAAWRTSSTSW